MMLAIISQSGYIRNKLTEISVYYSNAHKMGCQL